MIRERRAPGDPRPARGPTAGTEPAGPSGRWRTLIVADGDVPARSDLDAAWPGWADGVELVVAADGGWVKALALGLRPDLLVGDADSLPADTLSAVVARGVPVELSSAAKDESDAELAVRAALRLGARRLTILGALGGTRFDHAVANLGLLALPDPDQAEVELLDAASRVRLVRAAEGYASLPLAGPIGDLVSLLPVGLTAEGVTTWGLRFPLADESLPPGPARGLSNVRTDEEAAVSLRAGQLLVIESHPIAPARQAEEHAAGRSAEQSADRPAEETSPPIDVPTPRRSPGEQAQTEIGATR